MTHEANHGTVSESFEGFVVTDDGDVRLVDDFREHPVDDELPTDDELPASNEYRVAHLHDREVLIELLRSVVNNEEFAIDALDEFMERVDPEIAAIFQTGLRAQQLIEIAQVVKESLKHGKTRSEAKSVIGYYAGVRDEAYARLLEIEKDDPTSTALLVMRDEIKKRMSDLEQFAPLNPEAVNQLPECVWRKYRELADTDHLVSA